MKTNWQSKRFKFYIYVFVLFLILQKADWTQADIAPPKPPTSTNPIPGETITKVRMVSETVVMEIDADSPYDDSLAQVVATFTMRNLGETEEQMDVRFPLAQSGSGDLCRAYNNVFPPITDLSAWVNGAQVATYKTYETLELQDAGEIVTRKVPCWEHFPVSFPPDEDVIIKVAYTAPPYEYWGIPYFGYAYILETGAGWHGTIGDAEIVFRLPYELNELNFHACRPEDCTIEANEIRWHYEDFEPDKYSNVSISLSPPHLWQRILIETENTNHNPDDGEAWGRLGKAYKESTKGNRNFQSEEMYYLSKDAYQKAVSLLPNDADWHYGFAELLCFAAEAYDNSKENWIACVEQVKQALEVSPTHERANELLQHLADMYEWEAVEYELVDISGSEPDYLVLTPEPTRKPVVTRTPEPQDDLVAQQPKEKVSTPKPAATRTKLVKTSTPTDTRTATLPVTNTIAPSSTTVPENSPTTVVENLDDNPADSKLLVSLMIGVVFVMLIVIGIIKWLK